MSYFESRLVVNIDDITDVQNRLKFCEELGIRNVILEPKNNLKIISSDLKTKIEKERKISIFYRLNLKSNNLDNFKKEIKRFNKFPDIVSVESSNKDVQIHAARDSRVDILSFSNQDILKSLTPGVISLTKQNGSFIEFSLAPIMVENRSLQSKIFRYVYRYIKLVRTLKAYYIINGNFTELFDYRHPRALISVCYSLFDIPLVEAKKAFKENVRTLLNRSQKRQNESIFEEGVRLVQEEE